MFFWLKLLVVVLWTIFICVVSTLKALFHWGDKSQFTPAVHLLASGVLKITRIRFDCEGKENLTKIQPCIFLGNHQSFFDVIAFGSVVPGRTVPIGKKEIANLPFVGWWFKAYGAILIDRKDR